LSANEKIAGRYPSATSNGTFVDGTPADEELDNGACTIKMDADGTPLPGVASSRNTQRAVGRQCRRR